MLDRKLDRPDQLVAVVLGSIGDSHGFLDKAHKIGHDAYPESDPNFALRTLETQHRLYGFVNAVVVDVSRFGGVIQVGPLREFSSAVRKISFDIPIIGYSSKGWRGIQLRALTIFGVVDGFTSSPNITPEAVLNVYQQASNRRKSSRTRERTAA